MPTRDIGVTDHQTAQAVDEGRLHALLHALRDAARVGMADTESGQYTTFETAANLEEHIARLTMRALPRDAHE